jgi:hypothetical protein
MTPQEFRAKGWDNIKSARALLDQGHWDNAAYLVGYATEYALKARLCTRRGWAEFPENRKEATKRGVPNVITHDLDELLKLSDAVRITTASLHNIDWPRVVDWSAEGAILSNGSH